MDEPERAARPRALGRPFRDRMPGPGRARGGSAEPVPVLIDRFGLVLVLVVATVIVQSLIDVTGSLSAATLTHAISGAALAVAVRAAGVTRRWRRATDVFVIAVLIGNVVLLSVAAFGDVNDPRALRPQTLWLVAAVLVPAVVARRVLEHHRVTLGTVMGAVAAYLQIAVAYACVFQSLDDLDVGSGVRQCGLDADVHLLEPRDHHDLGLRRRRAGDRPRSTPGHVGGRARAGLPGDVRRPHRQPVRGPAATGGRPGRRHRAPGWPARLNVAPPPSATRHVVR